MMLRRLTFEEICLTYEQIQKMHDSHRFSTRMVLQANLELIGIMWRLAEDMGNQKTDH